MKRSVPILLVGAKGRMGQAISDAATKENDIVVSARCDRGDSLETVIEKCDVVVDFSDPSATAGICRICVEHNRPIVIGTTGHSSEQTQIIEKSAESVPIVFAPNFSVGVNALFWLTQKTAELLDSNFDLEIIEMHHRMKKDAPSGTAKKLAEILSKIRKVAPDDSVRYGRKGVGERLPGEIGVHALRGGDVVGEHRVIFAGQGERLELVHKASRREAFVAGVFRTVRWIIGRPPALYKMEDVLGL
jgi:4-hydroxy-tetrahydrodipicolinate reductase